MPACIDPNMPPGLAAVPRHRVTTHPASNAVSASGSSAPDQAIATSRLPAGAGPGTASRLCRLDRKSVVSGKRVAERVERGGRRILKNKTTHLTLIRCTYTYTIHQQLILKEIHQK